MSSNPMMRESVYEGQLADGKQMTVTGTVNKTLGLLAITVLTACYTWYLAIAGFADKLVMISTVSLIAGFIVALITAFRPQNSKILGICYAALEGLFLGGVSAVLNQMYTGIVIQAVLITFFCMLIMLSLFSARVIRATEKFRSVIIGATLSIAIFYILSLVLGFFHINTLNNLLASTSLVGIGLNVFVAIVACLNLILDFDFIERGANMGAPKFMEWYGAFSLLVTLIWLYIEVLRLLSKIYNRGD